MHCPKLLCLHVGVVRTSVSLKTFEGLRILYKVRMC